MCDIETCRLKAPFCLFNCSHSLKLKLTGMAIADITLLSGFEPKTEDLDLVSGSIGFHGLHVYRYSMINFFFYIYYYIHPTLYHHF